MADACWFVVDKCFEYAFIELTEIIKTTMTACSIDINEIMFALFVAELRYFAPSSEMSEFITSLILVIVVLCAGGANDDIQGASNGWGGAAFC